MKWLKNLFRRQTRDSITTKDTGADYLVEFSSGYSQSRAEAAMPGTKDLPQILKLVPPPLDEELVTSPEEEENSTRDYGPDYFASIVGRIPARHVFERDDIENLLYGPLHQTIQRPTYHVVTPEGQTTYLTSSDAPDKGIALLPCWDLYNIDSLTPAGVLQAYDILCEALSEHPANFAPESLKLEQVEAQFVQARRVIEMPSENVGISISPSQGECFDGKLVWSLLHSMGFSWGDMDCFQWIDPTRMTDYLIWVEADDGNIGYVLPEDVADGRQHFQTVRFSLQPARTPSPGHVVGEMIRAAEAFAMRADGTLVYQVDDTASDRPGIIREAVNNMETELAEIGFKPGSSAVCMLR